MAALSAGDFEGYLSGFTGDYVFKVDATLGGGTELSVPRRGLLRFLRGFLSTWHEVRYAFDPGAEVVEGKVFSHDRWVGRRQPDDPETSIAFFAVATFRGERVCEVMIFADRDEALAYARSS